MTITDNFDRQRFKLTELPPTGDDDRFRVDLLDSGGKYRLAISPTVYAVWKGTSALEVKDIAKQLAEKLNVLVGGNPTQNFFFNSNNCKEADSVNVMGLEKVLSYLAPFSVIDELVDKRTGLYD